MSGPAQHGVIIYANNPDTLARFYQQFLTMDIVRSSNDFIALAKPGLNIIIHVPPFDMPPERFNSVKLFTSVDHLQQAQQRLLELGEKPCPASGRTRYSLSAMYATRKAICCNCVSFINREPTAP